MFDEHHPLWRFCDAPLHWACYEDWPERPRFARQYVYAQAESLPENPCWGLALFTDVVCLIVRKREPSLVHVWLSETATYLEVELSDWSSWLSDFTLTGAHLDRLEIVNIWKALPDLGHRFPTAESVLAAVDWDAKERLARQQTQEREVTRRAWLEDVRRHNDVCRALSEGSGPERLACPYCQAQFADIEFVDRSADERKSVFVCRKCGRSFGHRL